MGRVDNGISKAYDGRAAEDKVARFLLLGENGMKRNRLQPKRVLLSVLVVLLIQALLLSQTGFCLTASNPIEEESHKTALNFQKVNNENINHVSGL